MQSRFVRGLKLSSSSTTTSLSLRHGLRRQQAQHRQDEGILLHLSSLSLSGSYSSSSSSSSSSSPSSKKAKLTAAPAAAATATTALRVSTNRHNGIFASRNENVWFDGRTRYGAAVSGRGFRAQSSGRDGEGGKNGKEEGDGFFSASVKDFASLGMKSGILLDRVDKLLGRGGPPRPTNVQVAAYESISSGQGDVTIGAETGSGKTLAYLLPLIDDILERKRKAASDPDRQRDADGGGSPTTSIPPDIGYDYARAIVLVPNKELVQQAVRMAMSLSGGRSSLVYGGGSTIPAAVAESAPRGGDADDDDDDVDDVVRLAIMPGGLDEPLDFPPFRSSVGLGGSEPPVDIVVTTPAALGPLALKPKNIDMFADVQTLVVDEADMLLDGGYLRPLGDVLMGFRRADRLIRDDDDGNETDAGGAAAAAIDDLGGIKKTQHVFVAATLPNYGLRSVDSYLQKRFPYAERVTLSGMHNARHYGLDRRTAWIREESKKRRMEILVRMLQTEPSSSYDDDGDDGKGDAVGLKGEKVMVFLNSVDDVDGACQALRRAGADALPYHAKIKLQDRATTLDRFRRYDAGRGGGGRGRDDDDDAVPILVCTDLAARGLDIPGVTAIVQLQFALNVVAHLHRMGRCGRAGRRNGRGIVFYQGSESDLVDVVREAEEQQDRMILKGDVADDEYEYELAADDGDGSHLPSSSSSSENRRPSASVQKAFSRKRGFTKKRKKLRKEMEGKRAASGDLI